MEKQYVKEKQKPVEQKQKIAEAPIRHEKKTEEQKAHPLEDNSEEHKHHEHKHEEKKTELREKSNADVKKSEASHSGTQSATHEEIEAEMNKTEQDKQEKKEGKKEEKKEKVKIVKKDEAVVNAMNLPISTKHSMAICDYIRGKSPEKMIPELEKVIKLRRAIPMKGEIPHRKGDIMSGRYPVNACKVFIQLLKGLKSNSEMNGIEEPIIVKAVPNRASRPRRRGGRERFKRTNVLLIAREKIMKTENKKAEEKK